VRRLVLCCYIWQESGFNRREDVSFKDDSLVGTAPCSLFEVDRRFRGAYCPAGYDCVLPDPFQFIIHLSPYSMLYSLSY
jgi:hypothetical protein